MSTTYTSPLMSRAVAVPPAGGFGTTARQLTGGDAAVVGRVGAALVETGASVVGGGVACGALVVDGALVELAGAVLGGAAGTTESWVVGVTASGPVVVVD